jgi:hypothetical protein
MDNQALVELLIELVLTGQAYVADVVRITGIEPQTVAAHIRGSEFIKLVRGGTSPSYGYLTMRNRDEAYAFPIRSIVYDFYFTLKLSPPTPDFIDLVVEHYRIRKTF